VNIISWNLLKINSNQSRDFEAIAREFTHLRADPFVFFVLESTGDIKDAEAVGNSLADAMGSGATRPDVQVVHVGGSKSRAENIIAVSRGVAQPTLEVFGDWAADWDEAVKKHQDSRLTGEQSRIGSQRMSLRTGQKSTEHGTVYSSARRLQTITADPPPSSDMLRSPAVFTCTEGGMGWKIMAVHSPGPQDGKHRDMTNADQFFNSMVGTLPADVDVVIGDFNQYGSTSPGDGLRECPGLGNTTHGTTRVSRLDRIYVRHGIFGKAQKFNEINNNLSDHLGIALVGAGRHALALTTVQQDAQGPIVGAGCRTCSTVHGAYRGLFRRWHICSKCKGVYCPGCGYNLPLKDWTRTRACPCGGQTALVS
jgi:hypothetical protein